MDRDEILSKSRRENRDRDLYVEEVNTKAGTVGSIVAVLLSTVFFVLQWLVRGEWNFGLYAIVFAVGAVTFTARYRYLRSKRSLALSVLYICAALALSALQITTLMAG